MIQLKRKSLKVYYNSACPVCRVGIHSQVGKTTECDIELQDVHSNNQLVEEIDRDLMKVRKYLHLAADNQLYVGIDAFIKLWENSPTERWKASLVSLPLIKQMAQIMYYFFANALYLWNRSQKKW